MWDKQIHDFGNVIAGKPVECSFTYKGKEKIISTRGSCGCTATKSKDNIITVKFTPRKGTIGYTSSKTIVVSLLGEDKKVTKTNLKITSKVYHNDEQIKKLDK